jgi:MFS family permease
MHDWLHTFGTYDPTSDNQTGYPWVIKTNNKSLVVSILSAGTFFGALLSNPIASRLGRKWGIIFSCVVFALGVGLQLDTKWVVFVIGRVVAGLGGTLLFLT